MIRQSLALLKRALSNNSRAIYTNMSFAVFLEFSAIALLYILNQVYGSLYSGIEAHDTQVIWSSIGKFTGLAMVLVGVNGYLGYFVNRLAFEIRAGLTRFILNDETPVYPLHFEQRVQEDFKRFGEAACDFWFAVLKSALHIPVFIGVILTLTKWYVALFIVLAVVVGTLITRIVALSLVVEQSKQESNEAQFRVQLNNESFNSIKVQFEVINRLFKRLSFTQSGLSQAFVLLPFMVLMPLYLSKAIAMGAFFQAVNALGKIIDSLSVLIDSRQVIVNIETCLIRLKFMDELPISFKEVS